MDSHRIILLNGARQVGKTTLLRTLIAELTTKNSVEDTCLHYIDLEDSEQLLIWNDQKSAIQTLPRDGKKHYFFIDEFQNAETIGSTLKLIHDHHPNIKLIITGSASWYLDTDESLAGRKRVIPIWPFSFGEFLEATLRHREHLALYRSDNPSEATVHLFNEYLFEFLLFGGYPEVATLPTREEKLRTLSELVNSYLQKDIKIYQYAANTVEVKKLLSLLATQIGSQLSISSLANNANMGISAVSNRLELLHNTFILHFLAPFFSNKQKEIIKSPKPFFIDTGWRNALLGISSLTPGSTDFGLLAENFVVTELLKKASVTERVSFWRTRQKQEVDIILTREDVRIPIEVKSGDQSSLPSGMKAFLRQYPCREAWVLNRSIVRDETYRDCIVHFRPIWFAPFI
jgi:predicted AAA+ superfamily ATPase